MEDHEKMPDVCKPLDARVTISAPISVALYPSGEMDVIFSGSSKDACSQKKQRIRFSPLAAAQFLDAIHAAAKEGHIVFGEDEQEYFH
ncbi:hypothetical protein G3O00_42300 [Burkholderia sp. Ac-20384]|uniref:hypothetical protein n=1 Tax=Burkholderia sp. Ac-20384 TaxID=2703902 RepID=UPI00197EA26E|nr:hypothetical protein [Burkholderia sp. Ac-20384]MBN3830136.1 hypothetical protein [Burkholderia sp. Ac-20384]